MTLTVLERTNIRRMWVDGELTEDWSNAVTSYELALPEDEQFVLTVQPTYAGDKPRTYRLTVIRYEPGIWSGLSGKAVRILKSGGDGATVTLHWLKDEAEEQARELLRKHDVPVQEKKR
jgi:hypothetical protein